MTKKINFLTLFKKFKFKVIRHFLITTIKTIIINILGGTFINLFRHEGKISNYGDFLPGILKKLFGKITLGKVQFISLGIIFISIFAFLSYLDIFYEEELQVEGANYVKNRL